MNSKRGRKIEVSPKNRTWALLGAPDHQGVVHVGGRIGAAFGPEAFRRLFLRVRGQDGVLESMRDLGDVGITEDISANHRRAAQHVLKAHAEHSLSVFVGGGHDHGYSHLRGLSELATAEGRKIKLGCINIDAHLDVRRPDPEITSGSPFYLALESKILKSEDLVEFGIQAHCNARELWSYAKAKKIKIVPFASLRGGKGVGVFARELKKLATRCDLVAVSLDLDAVAQAYAPGVSAPQAEGFSSSEIIEMMELAGQMRRVSSLGIFELNPIHDQNDLTARLAATAAYHFIASALSRPRARGPGSVLA